ncbi:hypothetical protein PPERSA_01150 [Pseudocohnilembus persalinus]|uniref:Tetratricopeptide repeat protein n=1 Tax=Pseudocohnilembus persalinus TaxID=266149 RepID=A0A0V0QVV6_PSEPJ|nr:hypothetical protein PPERSA_01150 [Pseudocohnilembus persalinus]|eukprot:KRX06072.1 hypothetical protein PPERSA_01150 [Pseudocohnilembus persalinus]
MDQEKRLYEAALSSLKDNNFSIALNFMNQVIDINQNNPIYYATRSGIKNCLQMFEDSLKDSQKAIKLDQNFVRSYMQEGYAYFNLKKYKFALRSYIKAQKLDPDNDVLKELIRKVNTKIGEENDRDEVDDQFEENWFKDTITKLSLHNKFKLYLNDENIVFKLELIDQSPQLMNILINKDKKLKEIIDYLNNYESGIAAEQQKKVKEQMNKAEEEFKNLPSQNESQNKNINIEQDTDSDQERENDKDKKKDIKNQGASTKQKENSQKQANLEVQKQQESTQGNLGSLEKMQKVFGLMACEMKSHTISDNISDFLDKFKKGIQQPGNSLQKENEIQKKLRHDLKNQINLGAQNLKNQQNTYSQEAGVVGSTQVYNSERDIQNMNIQDSSGSVGNSSLQDALYQPFQSNFVKNNVEPLSNKINGVAQQVGSPKSQLTQQSGCIGGSTNIKESMHQPFNSKYVQNNLKRDDLQSENSKNESKNQIKLYKYEKSNNMVSASQMFDLQKEIQNQETQQKYKQESNQEQAIQQQKKSTQFTFSFSTQDSDLELKQAFQYKKSKKQVNLGYSSQDEIASIGTVQSNNINEQNNVQIKEQEQSFSSNEQNCSNQIENMDKQEEQEIKYVTRTVGTSDFKDDYTIMQKKSDVQKYKNKGINFLKKQDLGYAVVNFNKAIKLQIELKGDPRNFDNKDDVPNLIQLLVYRVNSLIGIGNIYEGHRTVDQIFGLIKNDIPKIAIANSLKALLYEKEGKYELAQKYYQKSYDLEPSKNLKLQLDHIAKYMQNSDQYQKNPEQQTIDQLIATGDKLFSVGKYDYAIDEYKNAIKLDNKNSDAWIKLSNCQVKMKDIDSALISIEKSLFSQPKNLQAWLKKGYLHLIQKNARMAKASFELGLELEMDNQDLIKGIEKANLMIQQERVDKLQQSEEQLQKNQTKALSQMSDKQNVTFMQNSNKAMTQINKALDVLEEKYGDEENVKQVMTFARDKKFQSILMSIVQNPKNFLEALKIQEFSQIFNLLKEKGLLTNQ